MSLDSLDESTKSWCLPIFVEELNATHYVSVLSTTIVSVVFMDLIKKINLKYDWNEFWFWCPVQKIWLLPRTSALSQFNIQSYSQLRFIRRFNIIKIQLPDLQIRKLCLDFSKTVWQTNQIICKKIGIRHHEELSFQWRSLKEEQNESLSPVSKTRRKSRSVQSVLMSSSLNLRNSNKSKNPKSPRLFTNFFSSASISLNEAYSKNESFSPHYWNTSRTLSSVSETFPNDHLYYEGFENSKLSNSPKKSYSEAVKLGDIVLFKNYKDRSRLCYRWMISELTFLEQGIEDFSKVLLMLRFKYHNYYYLNEKYDEIRINQLFHQIHWSILSNETDCSSEESYILGGIMHQINTYSTHKTCYRNKVASSEELNNDIDIMLDKLHLELIGRCENQTDEESIEISGNVYLIKYPRNIFMRYEESSLELDSNGIQVWKSSKHEKNRKFLYKIPIRGNEIRMRINITKGDVFKLEIIILKNNLHNRNELNKPTDFPEKYILKFFDKQEFIKWATALRLLSKSLDFKLLSNYQYEYQVVASIVEMKLPQQNLDQSEFTDVYSNINLTDLIGPRFDKPFKRKEIIYKILFYAKAYKDYSVIQAKLAYIKCWLTFNNAGLKYHQVRFNNGSNQELIGIGYNRIIWAEIDFGIIKQSFEMTNIIKFDTNWQLWYSTIEFPDQTLRVDFQSVTDCQMFHEYLGGYLFIMLRNSECYSDLSEKTFRSMTAKNVL